MVCLNEGETSCTVHDTMPCATEKKLSIVVRPSYTVGNVFSDVSTQFTYQAFDLVLQSPNQEESVLLNDKKDKPLYQIPGFRRDMKNTLVLMPPGTWENNAKSKSDTDIKISPASDDELALGESASPTEPDPISYVPNLRSDQAQRFDARFQNVPSYKSNKCFTSPKPVVRYVGLVNQAMTCYLNSLLQALYMTPEFRNALYKWEFDKEDEAKSIPYHLQRLFLNLQTSTKIAIETTDLTKSFGWRSNEAWQQHDIQELCRVMFEALEKKFKNTEQADLINILYQGKMLDYVKCLECCTEKSREDTFLDIPLPVRPFNSAVAYGSVEEALRAFVQPETLDGNNQYFCEKCNKKCDAHKGLKFTKFPYILTLHLKRFDFDYETLHRIKLNDMVTFPQTLNLSSFVNAESTLQQNQNHVQVNGFANESENGDKAMKYDDCSTTDSGAALEEDNCSGTATIASSGHHDIELQDDDEGIDMSTSTDNRSNISSESNPYMYDLFAIMIHSGSASGGHYYAYIKDFDTGEYYCFNDQNVTSITQDDIEKSYGGGSKAYYSGAYSSSTNAYMLMYRQIDPKRNVSAMKVEQFPEHLRTLLQRMKEEDEEEKKPVTLDCIKPRVYFYNPILKEITNKKIYVYNYLTLEQALERAHSTLAVDLFTPLSRCRLVAYDHQSQEIERSLEGRDNELCVDVINSIGSHIGFLLETREENEEFDVYEPGGFTMKVFKVNIHNADTEGPYLVRAVETQSAQTFKKQIAKKLGVNVEELIVVLETSCEGVAVLKDNIEKLYPRSKVFVACEKNYTDETAEKLKQIVRDNFSDLTFLYLSVPNTDRDTLNALDIPPYEPPAEPKESAPTTPKPSPTEQPEEIKEVTVTISPKKVKVKKGATTPGTSPKKEKAKNGATTPTVSPKKEKTKNLAVTPTKDGETVSPKKTKSVATTPTKDAVNCVDVKPAVSHLLTTTAPNQPTVATVSGPPNIMTSSMNCIGSVSGGTESNSEDSSLSDGDRTLVESAPHDLSHVSSTSHSPQLSSPEDEGCGRKSPMYLPDDLPTEDEADDTGSENDKSYFRAYVIQDYDCMTASFLNGTKSDLDDTLRETAQKERKLKVILDKRMKIAALKRALQSYIGVPAEYFKISRKQTDTFYDGEQVSIELGRQLKKGEHKAKIYYLKLSDLNNESSKLPLICERIFNENVPVPDFKKDLIDHIHKLDPKYRSITLKNSRLWEKSGRSLMRIMQDDDIINKTMLFYVSCEMVLQEYEKEECPVGTDDSLTLFVRRWHPSTLELGKYEEVTLEKNDELKQALSDLSGIPVDQVAYHKENSTFPYTNINVATINTTVHWLTNPVTLDNPPLSNSRCGSVYFYKDSKEEPKQLSKDERQELIQKEKQRLDQIGGFTSNLYSPRREQSLKIYSDPSPVKAEATSMDIDDLVKK